jgi:hypothetical protein
VGSGTGLQAKKDIGYFFGGGVFDFFFFVPNQHEAKQAMQ